VTINSMKRAAGTNSVTCRFSVPCFSIIGNFPEKV
jgi:hypothetical protein